MPGVDGGGSFGQHLFRKNSSPNAMDDDRNGGELDVISSDLQYSRDSQVFHLQFSSFADLHIA